MSNYGSIIAVNRKLKKITQAELAEKLFISPQAVSKWENNQAEPDLATLKKISEILDISLDDFFKESEEEDLSKGMSDDSSVFNCYVTGRDYQKDEMYAFKPKPLSNEGHILLEEEREEIDSLKNVKREIKVFRKKYFKNKTTAMIVGMLVGLAIGLFILVSLLVSGNEEMSEIASYVGLTVLLTTLMAQMFYDSWLRGDFFFYFLTKTFNMPGVIFEFSLEGVASLIIIKILLYLITIFLTILVIILGFILSLIISPFSLIYEIIHIKGEII